MIKHIPHKEVNFYKRLIQDYLEKNNDVKPLIKHFPESINEVLSSKSFSADKRTTLVNTIKKQYQAAGVDVPKFVDSLTEKNTFTVTTGHQLSLFGGPLFFIYKIIETIKLADELNKNNTSFTVVPIFWMASEDHDFEEICSINIGDKKFEWKTTQKGAVGRFIIDELFIEEIKKLDEILSEKSFGKEFIKILQSSYKIGDSLKNGTRRFISTLFKNTNLLIIDGDDEDFKSTSKNIFEQELTSQTTYSEVSKTNQYLKAKNYHEQVFVRNINLFYLFDNNRERIEDTSFSKEELLKNIKFISPNALFRPLYQESILPNLVYIGGGGEIAYWLQLKSTFNAFGVDFPILSVRNSILTIDKSAKAKLDKFQISEIELFKPIEDLKKEFVVKNSSQPTNVDDELIMLKKIQDNLHKKVESIDSTLVSKINAIVSQTENALIDLEKRMIKAQKQKFETSLSQIEKIKDRLFPNGVFQERSESFAFYYSIYGDNFMKDIYNTITPFENSIKVRIDE